MAGVHFLLVLLVLTARGGQGWEHRDGEEDVRRLQAALDQADQEVDSFFRRVWGAPCITDNSCATLLAHCDRGEGALAAATAGILEVDGQCRPAVFLWLLLCAVMVILLCAGLYLCTQCVKDSPRNIYRHV